MQIGIAGAYTGAGEEVKVVDTLDYYLYRRHWILSNQPGDFCAANSLFFSYPAILPINTNSIG